jgi:hypothetical protein
MTTAAVDHARWIARAYELADAAVRKGNHPFGALVVVDGEVIAEGENCVHTCEFVGLGRAGWPPCGSAVTTPPQLGMPA